MEADADSDAAPAPLRRRSSFSKGGGVASVAKRMSHSVYTCVHEQPPPQAVETAADGPKVRQQRSASQDLAIITARLENMEAGPFLLDPTSEGMKRWDIWCGILLIYTAYMTPVEVAFMDTEIKTGVGVALFLLNRVIDLTFLADIFKCFFCKFQDENGAMVADVRRIQLTYIKGWFTLDVVSILPFDTLGVALENDTFSELKIVRVVRLLRLLKLLRLTRGMKMIERWQNEFSVDFGMLSLVKMFIAVLTMAHWVACMFRLIPDLVAPASDEEAKNWMTETMNLDGVAIKESSLSSQYITAVYWSTMTLTTVGYGDVPLPTDAERLFATLAMFIGGGVYAYVVGGICGIISSFGELNAMFQQNLDLLNKYMTANCVPQECRVELREYFRYSRHLAEYDRYKNLLTMMSPKLQAKSTGIIYGKSVHKFLDSIMPGTLPPRRSEAKPGQIVALNSNGTYIVQLDDELSGGMEEEVLGSRLVLASAPVSQECLDNDEFEASPDKDQAGHTCLVEGAAVLMACPYYLCTPMFQNADGTYAVVYERDGVRNMRVPLEHIREVGKHGMQEQPVVRIGQMVEARCEIPMDEFTAFTAMLANAMQPRTYMSREVIVANGSQPEGIFLVDRGLVASSGSLFTKGGFFCLEGVVFDGPTDREYRSVTFATVNLITKAQVEAVVATMQFPAVRTPRPSTRMVTHLPSR